MDFPEISVVLSGMSTMQQLEENIVSADNSGIGTFSQEDLEIIESVRRKYNERAAIPCTACSYCMPCPNNVDIPENFRLYNQGLIYEDIEESKRIYNNSFDESNRASECVQCNKCEKKCPQRIPISDWMTKVHNTLGK
jgi:predicted aldo/keto reductase-like oxidoreductase